MYLFTWYYRGCWHQTCPLRDARNRFRFRLFQLRQTLMPVLFFLHCAEFEFDCRWACFGWVTTKSASAIFEASAWTTSASSATKHSLGFCTCPWQVLPSGLDTEAPQNGKKNHRTVSTCQCPVLETASVVDAAPPPSLVVFFTCPHKSD